VNNRSLPRRSLFVLPVALLALAACSKPEPPRITPKEVKLVAISPTGIEVDVALAAENPNGIDLDARAVSATLSFDDGLEIGKTSLAKGEVQISGPLSIGVPFTIKGVLTRADLTKLALSSLPGLLE
jgi:hypothetical protein